MSTVTGGCSPNIAITQVGTLGLDPASNIPAAVLALAGQFTISGSAADQFNKVHSKTYVFAASTPQTLDLQSLVDVTGAAISFTVIRLFAYRIQATTATFVITEGNAGANEFNGILTSGSKRIWYPSSAGNSGYSIVQAPSTTGIPVSGSSHLLKLDPGTNAVGNVDIVIAGS
jgi:hypothetical protein